MTNLLGLLVLSVERTLVDFDATFDPTTCRVLDIWASPGLDFAQRVGRGAYWIDTLFSDAGLV